MKLSVCPDRAFSQLLQFQFSVGPDSSAIFGHKKPRNLSKNDKLRNIVGATLSLILAPPGLGNKFAIIYRRYRFSIFLFRLTVFPWLFGLFDLFIG